MHALFPCWPALVISTIYCLWHNYQLGLRRRDRTLRERVAYLLWVVADRAV